jgi:superfamily I DNA/RNA helicase
MLEAAHPELRWGDMAVLYRTNAQSRAMEESLVRWGIPYIVVGGLRFYDRREIRDMLAYLKLLVNPADTVSLLRVLNVPRRGIGKTTIERLTDAASQLGLPLWEVVCDPEAVRSLGGRSAKGLLQFCELIQDLQRRSQEAAPAGDPAPAVPIAITPPPSAIEAARLDAAEATAEDEADASASEEDKADGEGESEEDKARRLSSDTPTPRQRRRVAIVEAIDKITAKSLRFEVEVGGPSVRFNSNLIFTARACEVSADNEMVDDAIAFMEVALEPRAGSGTAPRQIFRGWMFASTPALSGLQHPIYDAWIVGCKA